MRHDGGDFRFSMAIDNFAAGETHFLAIGGDQRQLAALHIEQGAEQDFARIAGRNGEDDAAEHQAQFALADRQRRFRVQLRPGWEILGRHGLQMIVGAFGMDFQKIARELHVDFGVGQLPRQFGKGLGGNRHASGDIDFRRHGAAHRGFEVRGDEHAAIALGLDQHIGQHGQARLRIHQALSDCRGFDQLFPAECQFHRACT
ncbi:MAG: hypothetical protein BWZ10_03270 [candidate division BRC1 bacterium ADurb.BinA364]|nr:MAG: hypothetical protein BWZ10_03270 [candidate division BRC1 bacterium ADurb.BinA364]